MYGYLVVIGSVSARQYAGARKSIRDDGNKVAIRRFGPAEVDVLRIMEDLHVMEQTEDSELDAVIYKICSRRHVRRQVIEQIYTMYYEWSLRHRQEPAPWVASYFSDVLRIDPKKVLGAITTEYKWGGGFNSDADTDPFGMFDYEFHNLTARFLVHENGRVEYI